jgi:HD-GYP domain-containing protein (c-di-GMP phosphodiesterase class II)/DNA-binding CsgD family transcriptional regulator
MADSGQGLGVRLTELLGSISLATDLGTGQPLAHGVRSAVLASAIAAELGFAAADVEVVRRVALLRFLGCTADAPGTARLAGGDDLAFFAAMAPFTMGRSGEAGRALVGAVGSGAPAGRRLRLVAGALADPNAGKRLLSAHCEVAAMLAARLGVGEPVRFALAHGYERFDGNGFPAGLRGDAVPASIRVAVVARDADLWWRAARGEWATVLQARAGRAYDPAVVGACVRVGPATLAALDVNDPWQLLMAAESDTGAVGVPGPATDIALEVIADFVDLKSAWTRTHSRTVARLAGEAARKLGLAPAEAKRLEHAGLVHDIGLVGVPAGLLDRPGPLGAAGWERVRLHPYLTERILGFCAAFGPLARLAGSHHERLDGSGYHRGAAGEDLDVLARVLAAADVVAALGEDRPHRPQLGANDLHAAVTAEVGAGRLDRQAADAVLAAAGLHALHPAPAAWPAGLSQREVEVLRLIARGQTNKQAAAALHVSPKTVGRHVENLYTKIGVQSRAAAAVFAMEHHLL